MAKAKSPIRVIRPKAGQSYGPALIAFGRSSKPERVRGFVIGLDEPHFDYPQVLDSSKFTWGLSFTGLPKGRLDFYFFDFLRPLTTMVRVRALGEGAPKKKKTRGRRSGNGPTITYPIAPGDNPLEPEFWADGTATADIASAIMENEDDPEGHNFPASIIQEGLNGGWGALFQITKIQNEYRLVVTDVNDNSAQEENLIVEAPVMKKKRRTPAKKKK